MTKEDRLLYLTCAALIGRQSDERVYDVVRNVKENYEDIFPEQSQKQKEFRGCVVDLSKPGKPSYIFNDHPSGYSLRTRVTGKSAIGSRRFLIGIMIDGHELQAIVDLATYDSFNVPVIE